MSEQIAMDDANLRALTEERNKRVRAEKRAEDLAASLVAYEQAADVSHAILAELYAARLVIAIVRNVPRSGLLEHALSGLDRIFTALDRYDHILSQDRSAAPALAEDNAQLILQLGQANMALEAADTMRYAIESGDSLALSVALHVYSRARDGQESRIELPSNQAAELEKRDRQWRAKWMHAVDQRGQAIIENAALSGAIERADSLAGAIRDSLPVLRGALDRELEPIGRALEAYDRAREYSRELTEIGIDPGGIAAQFMADQAAAWRRILGDRAREERPTDDNQ